MGFGVYSYIYIIYINIYPHLQPHLPYPKRQGRGDTTTTAPHNHHHDISIYHCFIFYPAYCAFYHPFFKTVFRPISAQRQAQGRLFVNLFILLLLFYFFTPSLPSGTVICFPAVNGYS